MNRTLRAVSLALLALGLAVLVAACGTTPVAVQTPVPPTATSRIPTSPPLSTAEPAPVYSYRVLNTYPHDPNAFTQGLVIRDGVLYEGTGLRGRSTLRRVDLETGAVLQSLALPEQFFGEGVTVLGQRIYQLTWQAHVGFVYDRQSFEQIAEFQYPSEGWGLTDDGERLIMSDGTATLHFLDPETLQEMGQVQARDQGKLVVRLNELEYIRGEVWANVWQTDRIARIDPASGQVVGWIDLAGLLNPEDVSQPVDVLNGIAYDRQNDRLFVTGKWWPKLFQIQLVPQGGQ